MRPKFLAVPLLVAAALAASAGMASASTPGGSARLVFAPATATALTYITNDPDGGHGTPATWADDDFLRIVTDTRGAQVPGTDCGLAAGAGCWAYTMSLADSGAFTTIPGAGTPNQSCAGCAGKRITRKVTGALQGAYTVTFDASSPSPDGSLVAWTHNDHGISATAPFTSTTWGEQFFPAGTSFGNVTGGAYKWTYTLAFPYQQWVDSSTVANNDGNAPGDGNITG
jgi:hypothetical protein